MAVKGSVAVGIYPRRRPVQTASSLGNVAAARGHSQGLAREEATRKETAGEEASLGSAFPTTPVTNQGQPSNWPQVLNLYRPLHPMPTKICHPKNFLAPRQPSIQEPSCWGKIEEKCFNAKDGDLLKDNTLFKTKQGSSCHGRVSTIEAKQHNNDSSSRCLTLSWARINPKKPRIPPVYCQTYSNVSWNICRRDHGPTGIIENAQPKYQNVWPLDFATSSPDCCPRQWCDFILQAGGAVIKLRRTSRGLQMPRYHQLQQQHQIQIPATVTARASQTQGNIAIATTPMTTTDCFSKSAPNAPSGSRTSATHLAAPRDRLLRCMGSEGRCAARQWLSLFRVTSQPHHSEAEL